MPSWLNKLLRPLVSRHPILRKKVITPLMAVLNHPNSRMANSSPQPQRRRILLNKSHPSSPLLQHRSQMLHSNLPIPPRTAKNSLQLRMANNSLQSRMANSSLQLMTANILLRMDKSQLPKRNEHQT
jgi:hypothetical protein